MKLVTFSCRYLMLLSFLFSSSLSIASPYSNNEFDWAKTLMLSTKQQQQIKEIENEYRSKHKDVQVRDCLFKDDSVVASAHLKQLMHQDIHNILTPTQKKQASEVIQTQHRQMQLRHARELAYQLKMDNTQRSSFLNAIEDVQYNYQWPLNIKQRELARSLFVQLLEQHLDPEQLHHWQNLSQERPHKWLRSDQFKANCTAITN